ncbi:amidohydrolase family protein [Candidatus Nitrosocosmicus hydrocola]|uniref:amidohydrolase family protein n=1 Tax=Candidatus Nitrosocosmicus hydrocola TaxID=1826872 RepID=UPI000A7FAA70
MTQTIIDCHIHVNAYESLKNLSLKERIDALLDTMNSNNVEQAIIISSYVVNEQRPSTSEILAAIEKHENMHVVAGFSISNHDETIVEEYREYLKNGKIKGLKIYPGYEHYYPYDPKYQKVMDLCTEYDVPLMIHTGDTYTPKGKIRYAHPINVDDVAVDNPELKIIICHLGNPWFLDCQEIIYKNKNVYADISGLVLGDFTEFYEKYLVGKITDFLNYAGEPKYLLYGTDWPISSMKSYLQFVSKLDLNDQERELIMRKNSQRLFKI